MGTARQPAAPSRSFCAISPGSNRSGVDIESNPSKGSPGGRPETWIAAVTTLLLRIVLGVELVYVLYRVGLIIVMVLVAAMLALAVAPLVDRLERSKALQRLPRGVRRGTATSVVFLALAVLLVYLGFLIV